MMLLASALSNGDKENLALYLQTLGKIHLVEWTIEDKPLNSNFSIEPDKPTQLVLFNKTFEAIDLNLSKSITDQSIQLNPYETKALEWIPDIGVIKLNYNQSHLTIDVK